MNADGFPWFPAAALIGVHLRLFAIFNQKVLPSLPTGIWQNLQAFALCDLLKTLVTSALPNQHSAKPSRFCHEKTVFFGDAKPQSGGDMARVSYVWEWNANCREPSMSDATWTSPLTFF